MTDEDLDATLAALTSAASPDVERDYDGWIVGVIGRELCTMLNLDCIAIDWREAHRQVSITAHRMCNHHPPIDGHQTYSHVTWAELRSVARPYTALRAALLEVKLTLNAACDRTTAMHGHPQTVAMGNHD